MNPKVYLKPKASGALHDIGKVNAAFKAFQVIQKTGWAGTQLLIRLAWLKSLRFYNVIWMYLHWVLV